MILNCLVSHKLQIFLIHCYSELKKSTMPIFGYMHDIDYHLHYKKFQIDQTFKTRDIKVLKMIVVVVCKKLKFWGYL